MAFIILALSILALGQEAHLGNKPEKFNACLQLLKLKMTLDQEQLKALVAAGATDKEVGERVSSDMLIKCYTTISVEQAFQVLETASEDSGLTDELDQLVSVNYESYKETGYTMTPEIIQFYQDIKKMKEDAEIAYSEAPAPAPPLPQLGVWYVLIVVVIFSGLMFLLISKVMNQPEKKNRKEKKGKKKAN
jgi:hypothetical protein